jgi:hypothetical protein
MPFNQPTAQQPNQKSLPEKLLLLESISFQEMELINHIQNSKRISKKTQKFRMIKNLNQKKNQKNKSNQLY